MTKQANISGRRLRAPASPQKQAPRSRAAARVLVPAPGHPRRVYHMLVGLGCVGLPLALVKVCRGGGGREGSAASDVPPQPAPAPGMRPLARLPAACSRLPSLEPHTAAACAAPHLAALLLHGLLGGGDGLVGGGLRQGRASEGSGRAVRHGVGSGLRRGKRMATFTGRETVGGLRAVRAAAKDTRAARLVAGLPVVCGSCLPRVPIHSLPTHHPPPAAAPCRRRRGALSRRPCPPPAPRGSGPAPLAAPRPPGPARVDVEQVWVERASHAAFGRAPDY